MDDERDDIYLPNDDGDSEPPDPPEPEPPDEQPMTDEVKE
jgi:hypothetical protein